MAIRAQFRLLPGTYQVIYRSRNARRTELIHQEGRHH
jgi:hypothetical protein